MNPRSPLRAITEARFRAELERADGVMADVVARRGTSRHLYSKALRAGGVNAERQAEVIAEVRRGLCLAHYEALARKAGMLPTTYQVQKDHQWLWQRIRRHFATWDAFQEHREQLRRSSAGLGLTQTEVQER